MFTTWMSGGICWFRGITYLSCPRIGRGDHWALAPPCGSRPHCPAVTATTSIEDLQANQWLSLQIFAQRPKKVHSATCPLSGRATTL